MQPDLTMLLIALGALTATASPTLKTQRSTPLIPENLPDGYYIVTNDIDPTTGFLKHRFVAPIDWTKINTARGAADTTPVDATKRDNGGLHCNNRGAGDNSKQAQDAFIAKWNNYNGKKHEHPMVSVGNSVVYACIGEHNGVRIQENVFHSDMGLLDDQCGAGAAGWFSHARDGIDFGRDNLSYQFCGN